MIVELIILMLLILWPVGRVLPAWNHAAAVNDIRGCRRPECGLSYRRLNVTPPLVRGSRISKRRCASEG